MSHRFRPRSPAPGSAYVAALMALTVLTALALALIEITGTEVAIGANERAAQRLLYAADAGLHAAVARALGQGRYEPFTFALEDPDSPEGAGLRHLVSVSPFYPIQESPCDLCRVDMGGSSEPRYARVRFALTAEASRGAEGRDGVLGRKAVTTLLDVEPWSVPAAAYAPRDNRELLAKLRF